MGWNPFQGQSQGQQAGQIVRSALPPGGQRPGHFDDAWVVRAEDFFLHAVSIGFSGVSAFAIWQIFVSRHAGDLGRLFEGGVIAACFGIAGYFLSRNIAYRWMSGEMVLAYIPVCLVVELVEIYCNYVVGVSYLDLSDFFQTIPLNQHAILLTIGRIVVSSIPAMTLFLSVAQMDLERRKLQLQQPQQRPSAVVGAGNVRTGRQALPPMGPLPDPKLRQQQSRGQQPPPVQQNGANPQPGVYSG